MFLSPYCNLPGRTLTRLTENHVIMEKLKNPVSHISVLFRLRVKEKNMNRIFKGRREVEVLKKERNSFCCNACVWPVTPRSCHKNGRKLVHQLISNWHWNNGQILTLSTLRISWWKNLGLIYSFGFWPKSIRLSQCREEYFNYTQILKYRCCNIFGN